MLTTPVLVLAGWLPAAISAPDVRLVRAVAGVEPQAHRAQVTLGQVEAGKLGPGDSESEHPGRTPGLDRVEHRRAAERARPRRQAALRGEEREFLTAAERLVQRDDAGGMRGGKRGQHSHLAERARLAEPYLADRGEQAAV